MAAENWCILILNAWTSLYFLLGSAEHLPPPSNITFQMDEFCLVWKWDPPENTDCDLKYTSEILSTNDKQTARRSKEPSVAAHIENVDLNKEFIFKVQAECDSRNSSIISLATQLATGDFNTAVRNFRCVWHHLEYINCTWEPGPNAPPNVNYSLLYWSSESTCYGHSSTQRKQFQDWLSYGNLCQTYTYSNAIPTGCHFTFKKSFNKFVKLVTAVVDWSTNIRPYFYYVNANNIVKLKAPVIQNAYRTTNQSIFITWKDLNIDNSLLHEVLLEMSNSKRNINYREITGLSKEIPNAQSDVTYTVKVRVRLPRDSTDANMYLWSDWSEEKILPGQDDGRTISLLLLLLIPAVVIVAAVLLLIYMRRLKILMFPRIPDPGRVLSNDLQQWIKSGRLVYSEPKKEEICPVSLLESSLTSPYAE